MIAENELATIKRLAHGCDPLKADDGRPNACCRERVHPLASAIESERHAGSDFETQLGCGTKRRPKSSDRFEENGTAGVTRALPKRAEEGS